KTRSLLQALEACCGDARLLWIRPADQSAERAPLGTLADNWERATTSGVMPSSQIVVVLDDLQYHVSERPSAITAEALSFLAHQSNVLIAATCHSSFLRLDPSQEGRATVQPDPELVKWANERAILLNAELNEEELS